MNGWKLTAEKRRIKQNLSGGSGGSGGSEAHGSSSSSSSRGRNHGPLGYGLGRMVEKEVEIEGDIDEEIGGDMYDSGGEGGGLKNGEDVFRMAGKGIRCLEIRRWNV